MTDEEYALDSIRKWAWSGFYTIDEARELLDEIAEPEDDLEKLHAAIDAAFAEKLAAEATWADETDCDRLDAVFEGLHDDGICALQHAGYTIADGHSDVSEVVSEEAEGTYHGYCFFHGQDVEGAIDGAPLHIAFGSLDTEAANGLAVGNAVCAALREAGFTVEWDGTAGQRMALPSIQWQRRTPVEA
ncbi:DUF6891 domain-containing protein [Sphingomonas sp. 37zxx]|uniref:DUF6891 domain-containing protein n=1 Tax=Sphingomonas sp. 37zxx TaxID=1550073 RepID=UPI00053BFDC3|nr:hypothetical protein [Sphingomonas sp. 37zxx]